MPDPDRTQSRVPLPLCEVLDIIRTGYIEIDDLTWARELINDAVTTRVGLDIQAWMAKEKAVRTSEKPAV